MREPYMITHCRLPFVFDAGRLQSDLRRLQSLSWVSHFVPNNYQGDWSALPLRSIDGSSDSIVTFGEGCDGFKDTELLGHCSYFAEVLSAFKTPLTSVRLMKLSAGSEIKPHVDAGCGYEYGGVRLHVPIVIHPHVEFVLDGVQVKMAPGECWYMNFALPHHIINNSPVDRIHLVIDCQVNTWLDGVFRQLGFSAIERLGTRFRYLKDNINGLQKIDTPEARQALEALSAEMREFEEASAERAGTIMDKV